MPDNFKGGNAHLCNCIDALLDLDAKGALVPHGIGGHARTLLEAAASRLRAASAQAEPVGVIVANDPVHGWHIRALVDWEAIGEGTKLYAVPKR